RRRGRNKFAGRGIEYTRAVLDENLLARRIEEEPSILQRLNDRGGLGVAAGRDRGNSVVSVAEGVGREFLQALVEGLGVCRQRGEKNAKREQQSDQPIAGHTHLCHPGGGLWEAADVPAASSDFKRARSAYDAPPHFLVTVL